MCAAYDSPGFTAPWFTGRDIDPSGQMSAPGTAGAQPGKAGPVLATNVVVSHDNKSSQVKLDILPVLYAGDTSSFSDDVPVHLGGPFLDGGTQGSRPDRTGAGEGNAGHQPHPNAGK